jgi:hypothetical protein
MCDFHERNLVCWLRASSAANRWGRGPIPAAKLHMVSGTANEAGSSSVACGPDSCGSEPRA